MIIVIVEEVPMEHYTIPISKGEIVLNGNEATVVSWGAPLRVIQSLCNDHFIGRVEVIDLQTLFPWDVELVVNVKSLLFFHYSLFKRLVDC